jgi:hypothetical protein
VGRLFELEIVFGSALIWLVNVLSWRDMPWQLAVSVLTNAASIDSLAKRDCVMRARKPVSFPRKLKFPMNWS